MGHGEGEFEVVGEVDSLFEFGVEGVWFAVDEEVVLSLGLEGFNFVDGGVEAFA